MKSFLEMTPEERIAEFEAQRLPKQIREKKGVFKVKRIYEAEYKAAIFDPSVKPWPSHNICQTSSEGKLYDTYYAFCGVGQSCALAPGDLILMDSMNNVVMVVNANNPYCKIEIVEDSDGISG